MSSGSVETAGNRYAYFLKRKRNLYYWNLVTPFYECSGELDLPALRFAVEALVAHHDGLRLRFELSNGELKEKIVEPSEVGPCLVERACSDDLQGEAFNRFALSELQSILDGFSAATSLFRVLLLLRAGSSPLIVVVAHHLLADGYSFPQVVRDLFAIYHQRSKGEGLTLKPKTASLIEYTKASIAHWRSLQDEELNYWNGLGWAQVDSLKTDWLESEHTNEEQDTVCLSAAIGVKGERDYIAEISRLSRFTMVDIWITSIARGFRAWSNQDVLLLANVFHGRELFTRSLDLSRTVGWLADTAPLVVDARRPLQELLADVHRQVTRARLKGKSYNILRYCPPQTSLRNHPVPQVSLNIRLNLSSKVPEGFVVSKSLTSKGVANRPDTARVFLLSGGVFFRNDKLWLSWDFSSKLFRNESIQRFLDLCIDEYQKCVAELRTGSF